MESSASRVYGAMIEILAIAGDAACAPPLMPVGRGGGSQVDVALGTLARAVHHRVLAMADQARRAADDLEHVFFFGVDSSSGACESNREDR